MGQTLRPDNIPDLIRATSTTCTLAATNLGKTTRITIGGQQYALSSALTLNTATTGLGGLDTGSLSAATTQLWYVYACMNSSGGIGLVASLSIPSVGPTGFTTRYTLVGAFYTPGLTAEVGAVASITGPVETAFMQLVNPVITASPTPPAKGAGFDERYYWRRVGETIQIMYSYTHTVAGSAGSGGYNWQTPPGIALNTTKARSNVQGVGQSHATSFDGTTLKHGYAQVSTSGQIGVQVMDATTNLADIGSSNTALNNTTVRYGFNIIVPVSGWSATLLG